MLSSNIIILPGAGHSQIARPFRHSKNKPFHPPKIDKKFTVKDNNRSLPVDSNMSWTVVTYTSHK